MKNKKKNWYVLGGIFFSFCIFNIIHKVLIKKKKKSSQRELSILCWSRNFDINLLNDFEKTTGIKIHLGRYSTNEELISKIKLNKSCGIDLIIPSDYAVQTLYKLDLIKSIDENKILFMDKLYTNFLECVKFDNNKIFAIPMEWGFYGFLIDKDLKYALTEDLFGTMLIENKDNFSLARNLNIKFCMTNDYVAAISYVYHYLKSKNNIKESDLTSTIYNKIRDYLINQKKYISLYSDTKGADAFTNKEINSGYVHHGEYIQSMNNSKFFFIPSSGALLSIEYFAIPKEASHIDEIYEFLNYYFNKKIMAKNAKISLAFPSIKDGILEMNLDENILEIIDKIINKKIKVYTANDVPLSEKDMLSLWLSIKSSK